MQLAGTSQFSRIDGIEQSLVRPDSETRRLLKEISQSDVLWDEGKPYPLLQSSATVALAALGENRAVVESILRWGIVPHDLPDMRAGQLPMSDEELGSAIKALSDSNEKVRNNAIQAIGVSGRTDLAPKIRDALTKAPADSKIALSCIVALNDLNGVTSDLIPLLKQQLEIKNHSRNAAIALLRTRTDESRAILQQKLQRGGVEIWFGADNVIAENLAVQPESKKLVAEELWKSVCKGYHRGLGGVPAIESLAEINSPEIHNFLIEEATWPEGNVHVQGNKVRAIRALAQIDRDAAFRAAEMALLSGESDADEFAYILIELDVYRAIDVISDILGTHISGRKKAGIGRVLRRNANNEKVHEYLHELLESESAENRVRGIELCAWQHSERYFDKIKLIAVNDNDQDVRAAGVKAVFLLERQRFTLELLEALEKTNDCRCWSYIDAVVEVGDPWLLTSSEDTMFLWKRISKKSPGLQRYAYKLLKERKKKIEQDANSEKLSEDA